MKLLPRAASVIALSVSFFASAGAMAQDADRPTGLSKTSCSLVVPGWRTASGWKSVYDILMRDGFHVSLVQEPLTSLADDVAAAKRVIDLQDGPRCSLAIVMAGRSSRSRCAIRTIVGLVYVAAHAPNVGENEGALGKKTPSVIRRRQAGVVVTTA